MTSSEAWVRRPRNRCKNLKERKAIRNYYDRKAEEIQTELQEMRKKWEEEDKFNQISAQIEQTLSFRPPKPELIYSKHSIFNPAFNFLAANLAFKQVLPDPRDPLLKLPEADGRRCAKSLSILWQFVLPQVITFLEKNHYSSIAHLFIIQVRSKTLKHLDFFCNRRGSVG